MVLAYEDDEDKKGARKKREAFEKHLKDEGLELETEYKTVRLIDGTELMKDFQLYKITIVHKL